jgi:hypothetical protein
MALDRRIRQDENLRREFRDMINEGWRSIPPIREWLQSRASQMEELSFHSVSGGAVSSRTSPGSGPSLSRGVGDANVESDSTPQSSPSNHSNAVTSEPQAANASLPLLQTSGPAGNVETTMLEEFSQHPTTWTMDSSFDCELEDWMNSMEATQPPFSYSDSGFFPEAPKSVIGKPLRDSPEDGAESQMKA